MTNHPNSLLYQTSLERYEFARRFIDGKNVLDIACGSGYGSAHLAEKAKNVTGVDIDGEVIDYCKKIYPFRNLDFLQIDKNQVLEDFSNKFDVIVSLETIEHVADYEFFLTKLKKYLKDEGRIILSTPNNFKKINPPENKFHVREFDIMELHEILKKLFPDYRIEIFGQGKTNFRRLGENKRISWQKNITQKIFKKIYDTDKRTVNLLSRIEHLNLYKKISDLQKDADFSGGIYKIDPKSNFNNPVISLFLIETR